ncbi:MAG TPA: hypothetical protein VMV45_13155 [Casimicrobiaceae bacterium]|nr:hypothetical protein [Casimicrobiaceae bacterium]
MSNQQQTTRTRTRSYLAIAATLGWLAVGMSAWAANDLDTPVSEKARNADGSDTFNTAWVGHISTQGRTIYQTSVHNQNGRVIAYAGHFGGTVLNPMNGKMEVNGTSIVDVTDPSNPIYLKHLPSGGKGGGGRMNRLCEGNDLPKGLKNHTYLLRESGSDTHEVWDVTAPENPTLVSTPVTGVSVTHKNWWDCSTGLAYIVVGTTATSAKPDGWFATGSNQHVRVYDLSDPASPKYVMDFGLPGQNPGSDPKTAPSGVHGPIVVSTMDGVKHNRMYMPYGVGENGVIQIVDLTKMLPAPYGNGKYVDPSKPTNAELLQSEVGRITMPGYIGGHTAYPIYGVEIKNQRNYEANTALDLLAVTSEETDNRCTGAPHLLYLLDITAKPGSDTALTTAEQHPWPISTVTVNDFSGRPNFCSRGTRFGVHSTHENMSNKDFYGTLLTSAWFDAGIRVTDIRDPYNPKEVAYFIAPVNAETQPSNSTVDGITYSMLDVSCDNTEIDENDYIYCGDRVGGGLDIVKLTGPAAAILESTKRTRMQK